MASNHLGRLRSAVALSARRQFNYFFVAPILVSTLITGCGVVQDRSDNYVEARSVDPVRSVDGSPLPGERADFPIPELPSGAPTPERSGDVPPPPDLTSEILEQNYVIESVDDRSWLLVNDVPGQLWPKVAGYLDENGFGVAFDSPQLGVMQSELANYSQKARLTLNLTDATTDETLWIVQARIRPGVRRKTTEVLLRPMPLDSAPNQLLSWPERPFDSELERNLLADLGDYLKAREGSKSYSRAALNISTQSLVSIELGSDDRPAAINLALDRDRSWAEVQRAIGDAGIDIVDRDRSQGRFYVDHRNESERDQGLFSWFQSPEPAKYTYHIDVSTDGSRTRVTAGKAADWVSDKNHASELLQRIYDNLY